MGRAHADTVCVVCDPHYDDRGWFIHGEFGFVELCHGDNVKESEDYRHKWSRQCTHILSTTSLTPFEVLLSMIVC